MDSLENAVDPQPLSLSAIRPGYGVLRMIYNEITSGGRAYSLAHDSETSAGITIALVDALFLIPVVEIGSYLLGYS